MNPRDRSCCHLSYRPCLLTRLAAKPTGGRHRHVPAAMIIPRTSPKASPGILHRLTVDYRRGFAVAQQSQEERVPGPVWWTCSAADLGTRVQHVPEPARRRILAGLSCSPGRGLVSQVGTGRTPSRSRPVRSSSSVPAVPVERCRTVRWPVRTRPGRLSRVSWELRWRSPRLTPALR